MHTHVYFLLLYLECESRLLVCCVFEVVTVHGDNLITSPQLTAQVRRSSRQDERYEDPFSILTSNNIETEAGRSLGENYRSRSPVKRLRHKLSFLLFQNRTFDTRQSVSGKNKSVYPDSTTGQNQLKGFNNGRRGEEWENKPRYKLPAHRIRIDTTSAHEAVTKQTGIVSRGDSILNPFK